MPKPPLQPAIVPSSQVSPTSSRRRFAAEYKAKILEECDRATAPGAIGEILRREGLYSSHLVDWRRLRAEGGADGLAPRKTGRPLTPAVVKGLTKKVESLERENALLTEKLRRADLIADAQKKLAEVLATLAKTQQEPVGSSG